MESQNPNSKDVTKAQIMQVCGEINRCTASLTATAKCLLELKAKQNGVQEMLESDRRRLENLQNNAKLDAMLSDITTNAQKLKNSIHAMQSFQKKSQMLLARAQYVETVAKNRAKNQ